MPDYSKFRISLPEEYNMSAADFGRVQLVNVPNWKTIFPKMYERYRAVGWTDDKLGKMTRGWAAWEDWLWGTSGLPYLDHTSKPMICGSHRMVDFHKPWSIGVTHPITQAFGRYDGYNSHPTAASGSEIDIWLDQYVDDPSLRLVVPQLGTTAQRMIVGVKTATTGNDGSAAGYTEVGQFSNWYLKGNRVGYQKQGELIVGYLGWDCGTNSACGFLHSHGTDIPYMFARGTPVNGLGPLTAMNCNVAGVAIVGGAQNSFNFAGGVEVDDCPTGVLVIAGFGREAGGRAKFNFIKIETAVSSEDRGPWKGTIVADINGQFNFDFGLINYAAGYVQTDSLFIVDNMISPDAQGRPRPQRSQFKASLQGYGYQHIVHDKTNGKLHSSPGDHCPIDIQWQEDRGLTANRSVTTTLTTNKTRLGFQRFANGVWTPSLDHSTGTPAYNYQGVQGPGIPTVATWILGTPEPWSVCANGTQTRRTPYVSSIVGQTPSTTKPADMVEAQACATPPTGVVLASYNFNAGTPGSIPAVVGGALVQSTSYLRATSIAGGKLTNSNTIATYPVAINGVRKVVLNGLRPSAMGHQQIAQDLVLYPTGEIHLKGVKCAQTAIAVIGSSQNIEVTLPQATNFGHLLAIPGAGNAYTGDLDEVHFIG